jgi:rubrerythrin
MIEDLTLKGCLEFAVATEELGAKIYARLAAKFNGAQDVSELFSRLAADEKVHKRQFSDFLKQAPEEEGTSATPEKREYLKAMSISEFFSHRHGPFQNVEKIQDRNDALQVAFEFEKATLGFYRAVEEVLGKHEILSQVMETERNHVVILMKTLLVDGSKFRGLQDRWP